MVKNNEIKTENLKERFENFLKTRPKTPSYYLQDFNKLNDKLMEKNEISQSFYHILDINFYVKLKKRLLSNGDLNDFNLKYHNGGPSAVVQAYIDFLTKNNNQISETDSNLELIRNEFINNDNLKNQKEYEHNINYFKIIKRNIEQIYNFWNSKSDLEKKEIDKKYKEIIHNNNISNRYSYNDSISNNERLTKDNFFIILNNLTKNLFDGEEIIKLFVELTENINAQNKQSIGNFIKGFCTSLISTYFNFVESVYENKTNWGKVPGLASKANEIFGLYNLSSKTNYIQNSRVDNFLKFANISDYKTYKNYFNKEINELKKYLDLSDLKLNSTEEDNMKENLIADRLIYEFTLKHSYFKTEIDKGENLPIVDNNVSPKNLLKIKKQIILYGPPGTGKTYSIKNKIIEYFPSEIFETLQKENRIKFITFHQSYSYEEFIEGIKPNIDGNKEISYKIEDGIFKQFSRLAEENYLRSRISGEEVDFNKLIEKCFEKLEDEEVIMIPTKRTQISIYEYNDKTIFFEKKNKDRSHSLSIKTLRKIFFDSNQEVSKYIKGGLEPYYKSVLNFLNKNLENIRKESFLIEKETEKPFFLIIDEINRGNISKIFGELITLLESNKRLGEKEELILNLPYSNEPFTIPPNLYIIGTMNTSDKSIATLDIALRRRFGFIEMLPNSELISNDIEGFNLRSLFENLNNRIEFLLDKDHLIGHSFFCNEELVKNKEDIKEIFITEIIPLLEEYFYGDVERLKLVLGNDFFEKKRTEEIRKIFGNNSNLDIDEDLFKLKDFKTTNEDIMPYLEKIINLEKQENKDEE